MQLRDTLLAPRILRWRRVWPLVGIVTGLHVVLDFRQGRPIYLLCKPSRSALGSTQPPVQWPTGALFPAVRRPKGEADH